MERESLKNRFLSVSCIREKSSAQDKEEQRKMGAWKTDKLIGETTIILSSLKRLLEEAAQREDNTVLERLNEVLGELQMPYRNYKDRLFRMIFKEKEEALSLYNAVNHTNYTNAEDLTINTLDNVIYLEMKNDVSFVLYGELNMYEHQSTYSPNLPLRNLLYAARVYGRLVKDRMLYGSRLIKVPAPKFVVFYNGREELPEQFSMKLSDAYQVQNEEVSLELVTQVYNINEGRNPELLAQCRMLQDYVYFVECVRKQKGKHTFSAAVEIAMQECINRGILSDFLRKNRAEVLKVTIFEFNREEYEQIVRKEGREEGLEQGISALITTCLEVGISFEETLNKVKEKFSLSQGDAEEKMTIYWQ